MVGCLILHGYTGSAYEIEPLANYLKTHTDWDVRVPTLPGHGAKLSLENVSHKKWLEKSEDTLIELNEQYEDVYLIGFSMGGMIAAYLAAKYKINKLVLLATAGKYISIKQMGVDLGEIIADSVRGELSQNPSYLYFKKKAKSVPLKANLEFLKLVRYTRKYLSQVYSPVLIAQGRQDSVVPASTIHYLDKKIPSKQKEVVLFERSNHLICLGDDKDILNQIVYDFLTKEQT